MVHFKSNIGYNNDDNNDTTTTTNHNDNTDNTTDDNNDDHDNFLAGPRQALGGHSRGRSRPLHAAAVILKTITLSLSLSICIYIYIYIYMYIETYTHRDVYIYMLYNHLSIYQTYILAQTAVPWVVPWEVSAALLTRGGVG